MAIEGGSEYCHGQKKAKVYGKYLDDIFHIMVLLFMMIYLFLTLLLICAESAEDKTIISLQQCPSSSNGKGNCEPSHVTKNHSIAYNVCASIV